MGYGILAVSGTGELSLLAMGVLKLNALESHYERLHKIYDAIQALIRRYHPTDLAIEAPFYGKNVQSMLKLGRAQGAAIVAAKSANLPVTEYPPSTIKRAIIGRGNASKEQVSLLLQKQLSIPEESLLTALDATDAVAVALCHHIQETSPVAHSKSGSWADFVRKNPGRIK